MAKKLTLTDIKKSNSKYNELTRVDLDDDTYVNIYKEFSPVKLNELVKEMATDGIRAEKEGIEFDIINMTDWALFSIIYKFSDLGIPSDIKKKVQAFHSLIEYDYFGKIAQSFPEESLLKVTESLKLFQQSLELLHEQKKIKENVE